MPPLLDAAGATIKIGPNTISATGKNITEPNTSEQIQPQRPTSVLISLGRFDSCQMKASFAQIEATCLWAQGYSHQDIRKLSEVTQNEHWCTNQSSNHLF